MHLVQVVEPVVDHLRDVVLDAGLGRLVRRFTPRVLAGAGLLVRRERHQRHGEHCQDGGEQDDDHEGETVLTVHVAHDRLHMSDLTVTLSVNLVLRPRFVRTVKSSWAPVTALAVVVVLPFAS